MSSPTAEGKKSKKERKSKFEDSVEEEGEKSILHDDSIAISTSKKRRGFESRFTSEQQEDADGGDPTKKVKVTMNPYTNRASSKRYYEILKGREQLPAWEAKKHLLKLLDEN